ncbi:MAG: hypothetical protein IJ131_04375, partial [Eggerthellaceae bacterium]|nr:hypothetical protein [Eggerthellaceae bacterium]
KPVAGFIEDAVRDYLAKLNDNPDQARKSLQHYSSSVIQFDMPQNWVDIVTGDTLDHTSGVYHVDFNLVGGTIGSFPMVFRVDGMEGDSSVSCSWIDSLGEVVWDQAHDASMYANLSDQDMDFVVTALTGGAVTRAQLLAETDRAACQLLAQKHVDEFMRTQVVPNVVASSDGSQGEGPAPENAASTTPAAPEPEPQLEPDPEPAPEASLPEQMLASMDGDWTTVSVGRRNGIMRITGGVCESISNDGQSRLYCTITPDIFERYDNGLSGEFNGGPGYFIPTGNYDYGFYVSDEDFYDNGRIDGLVPIRRDGSGYSGGDTLARVEDLDF